MSDPATGGPQAGMPDDAAGRAVTAGALLRRAREAQGMHVVVLAAVLKVPQRKLDALESDRLDELPDATFARALAQSVCRVLKVDATEVLALLPPAGAAAGLEQVSAGLNAPFRDRPGLVEHTPTQRVGSPAVLMVLLLAVGALALWFWPTVRELSLAQPAPEAATTSPDPTGSESLPAMAVSARDAASEPAATRGLSVPAASAVLSAPASASVAQPAPDPAPATVVPTLALRASTESWVEVVDADGRTLVSRMVAAGESLSLEGNPPLRLVIGNVAGTELRFRGEPVELTPAGGGNVARIELR